jgi:hypothetical protein
MTSIILVSFRISEKSPELGAVACTCGSSYLGRLRQKDHLSPGV